MIKNHRNDIVQLKSDVRKLIEAIESNIEEGAMLNTQYIACELDMLRGQVYTHTPMHMTIKEVSEG